ncbi:MAG: hypothetical protein R2711_02400 [Acidimicrobiales bacterium]
MELDHVAQRRLRAAFGNPNTPTAAGDLFPIQHPVLYTWIWIVAIVAVVAPIAVGVYRRSTVD